MNKEGKGKKRGKAAQNTSPNSPARGGGAGSRLPYGSFESYGAGHRSRLDALSSSGLQQQDKPSTFLPRLAKQKVLDKFIDLSTADVFHRTGLWPQRMHPKGGSNVVGVLPPGQTSLVPNLAYAGARRDVAYSALDHTMAAAGPSAQTQYIGGSVLAQMKQNMQPTKMLEAAGAT